MGWGVAPADHRAPPSAQEHCTLDSRQRGREEAAGSGGPPAHAPPGGRRRNKPLLQKPLDGVDPAVLGAVSVLLAAYAGDFTLGGLVREVSIFGGLQAQPGYMDFGGKPLRAVEITVPVIVNDAWDEVP